MSTYNLIFSPFLVLFLLINTSCADDGLEKAIIGKWIGVNVRQNLEFLQDDTVIVTPTGRGDIGYGRSIGANYKFIDKDRIKIAGPFGGYDILIFNVSIKDNVLTLKGGADGRTDMYRRE